MGSTHSTREALADSALYQPTRAEVCKICRCRLLSSTLSKSKMPIKPGRQLSCQLPFRLVVTSKPTYSCAHEILQGRTAQPTCSDHRDAGRLQSELARQAKAVEDHLTAITLVLWDAEGDLDARHGACWDLDVAIADDVEAVLLRIRRVCGTRVVDDASSSPRRDCALTQHSHSLLMLILESRR